MQCSLRRLLQLVVLLKRLLRVHLLAGGGRGGGSDAGWVLSCIVSLQG